MLFWDPTKCYRENRFKFNLSERMECGTPNETKNENTSVSWQQIIPRNQIFEGIHGHSTVRYGNDLWIFGGTNSNF